MAIDLMIAHTKIEEGSFPHKWVVTSDSSSYAKTIIIAYCSTEAEAKRVQRTFFNLGKRYKNISEKEPFP